MADLSQGLLGGSINDLLAYIDSRKKVGLQNLAGLLGMGGPNQTPTDTVNGLLGNVAAGAQGQLDAAQGMDSAVPGIRDQSYQQMIGGLLNSGGILGQTVYHGTPHTFDRFDLSKIGTGEGAQAYGHGMYFAENPAVADQYARTLSNPSIEGRSINLNDPAEVAAHEVHIQGGNMARAADRLYQAAQQRTSSAPPTVARQASELLDSILNNKLIKASDRMAQLPKIQQGNMLAQDLPDSVLPTLLQWDKPLSEQPEAFAKLKAAGIINDKSPPYQKSGKATPQALMQMPGEVQSITQALTDAGIPGLSYLDQGSRAAPGGTRWTVTIPGKSPLVMDFKPTLSAMPPGTTIEPVRGTMNHVIWDQGLLDQMTPTPYSP